MTRTAVHRRAAVIRDTRRCGNPHCQRWCDHLAILCPECDGRVPASVHRDLRKASAAGLAWTGHPWWRDAVTAALRAAVQPQRRPGRPWDARAPVERRYRAGGNRGV